MFYAHHSFRVLITVVISLILGGGIALAQQGCGVSDTQYTNRWIWNDLQYCNNSSTVDSTIVGAAALAWNNVQSKFSLSSCGSYDDIDISDNTNIPDGYDVYFEAESEVPNGCNNTYNACGTCMNSTVRFRSTIKIHPARLAASVLSPATADDNKKAFMVHEFGHALGLNHPTGSTVTACNQISSIMHQYPNESAQCGILLPISSCDPSSVNSANTQTITNFCTGACSGACS